MKQQSKNILFKKADKYLSWALIIGAVLIAVGVGLFVCLTK